MDEKKQNWFMKHKVMTGVIAVITLLIIVGSTGKKDQSSQPTAMQSTATATTETAKMAKIGETAQSGDIAFTVIQVKDYPTLGSSYTVKKAQGVFKVITIKIANTGKETKTIDSSMMKLKDKEGRTFERSIEGQTAKGMSEGKIDLFLQQVQPGLAVEGELVFDTPIDVSGLVLEARGSLLSAPAEISLTE